MDEKFRKLSTTGSGRLEIRVLLQLVPRFIERPFVVFV
jgi:hypothetical protein